MLKVLVSYELLKTTRLRGLVSAIAEAPLLQRALGGAVARNTLSNALRQRDQAQMIEAWMLLLAHYAPHLARCGKKFARVAAVDASLIALSLAAYTWAAYRSHSGAAKMSVVLEWVRGIPQQLVFTTGQVADLRAAARFRWQARWTYLFDRGYFSFDFLTGLVNAGAHFVIRFKAGVNYTVVDRQPVPETPASAGFRVRSDWLVRLAGWEPEVLFRLVSYQLPDGTLLRVLTDRFELSATNVAWLYKERWTIENWWKWIKQLYKVKEPLGRSENALPVQLVGAFVTDLLLRAFHHRSGFTKGLFQFVRDCQEFSLLPLSKLSGGGTLRPALERLLSTALFAP